MKTVPFNAEQAKAGRPVVSGEVNQYKVGVLCITDRWVWCTEPFGYTRPVTYGFSQLSHPSDPAPGHNPAQLDEWTVGTHEGWRLLEKEEIRFREESHDIEGWAASDWGKAPYCGSILSNTYRTRRPAGYFLPKVVTRNLRPEELPEEFLVMDGNGKYVAKRINWTNGRIDTAAYLGEAWSRSLDGPWNKFTVEETK